VDESDERVGLLASASHLPDHIFFCEKSADLGPLRRAAAQPLERERAFYRIGEFGKTNDRAPFARRIDVSGALIADHLQRRNVLEPRLHEAHSLCGQEQSFLGDRKWRVPKLPRLRIGKDLAELLACLPQALFNRR
jgi:hypothetical protein